MDAGSNKFRERVITAAENALATGGSVGPLELLQHMRLLEPSHVDSWRRGRTEHLDTWIQGSPEKLAKAYQHFFDWVRERELKPVQASYTRAGAHGIEELKVTALGDPAKEAFFRTHYAPADLPQRKARQLEAKLKKAPDLVVFETVSKESNCSECKAEMFKGNFLFMEKGQPLCLACADLDHLVFLPSGDATLSRRARKHSPLSAVVVRFSRARKRYERQGVLITEAALAQAEAECVADAPERAVLRAKAAERRQEEDAQFVPELVKAILGSFPKCPAAEAEEIARHTALRGSGRVGRSAAGRALDAAAVTLAVVAHIRHTHTIYDELLMKGVERASARASVREQIDRLLQQWRCG
jgi:hypothetical protein